jgi:hypothetical protein
VCVCVCDGLEICIVIASGGQEVVVLEKMAAVIGVVGTKYEM